MPYLTAKCDECFALYDVKDQPQRSNHGALCPRCFTEYEVLDWEIIIEDGIEDGKWAENDIPNSFLRKISELKTALERL